MEADAKLAPGPVGSIWKLTRRRMKAKSVYGFARATSDHLLSECLKFDGLMLDVTFAASKGKSNLQTSSIKPECAERIGIEPTSVPRSGTDDGFEDREGHQAPFTLPEEENVQCPTSNIER